MKKYIKAIFYSNVFDIVVSSLLGVIIGLVFFSGNVEEIKPYMYVIGGGISVLSGYISAMIAKERFLLMGALSSILCVTGGLFVIPKENIILGILLILISPVLGTLGGYIFSRVSAK